MKSPAATRPRLDERGVLDLLHVRFCQPEWAMLEQVANKTGWASRTLDAVAMSLWPSRGLEVHGIEVKVHRGDWIREKRNPEKADDFFKHFDRFWLVAEADVVAEGELPPTWGLLVVAPDGKSLQMRTDAPKGAPQELGRKFVAAILRRVDQQYVPSVRVRQLAEEIAAERAKLAEANLECLRASVAKFEAASGVEISAWRGEASIGAAVKVVLEGGFAGASEHLERVITGIRQTADGLEKAVSEMRKLTGQPPTADRAGSDA